MFVLAVIKYYVDFVRKTTSSYLGRLWFLKLVNFSNVSILMSSFTPAGVGKSSLAHLICTGEELKRPRSTVGCTIHVKVVRNVTSTYFHFGWYQID